MTASSFDVAFALSPMQEGLLASSLRMPHSGLDIGQIVVDFNELVSVSALQHALSEVHARHELLRAVFAWEGLDSPTQRIQPTSEVSLEQYDWRELTDAEQRLQFRELVREDRIRGFDLSRGPLSRCVLIRLATDRYRLLWTIHHIIIDERAALVILSELSEIYDAQRTGGQVRLPVPGRYSHYIDWLRSQDPAPSTAHWTKLLGSFESVTPLPYDLYANNAFSVDTYREQTLHSAAPLGTAILRVSEACDVTANTIIQGAWALVLGRYADARDIVFGSVRAGRHAPIQNSESLVGMTIYNVPVRLDVRSQQSVREWLRRIRTQQVAVRPHEHSPLSLIQSCTGAGAVPLFESLLVFETLSLDERLRQKVSGWRNRSVHVLRQPSYPLSAACHLTSDGGVAFRLNYYEDRFRSETIRRLLVHFADAADSIVRGLERPVRDLSLVSPAEREMLLARATRKNAGDTEADSTIHSTFTARAAAHPDKIAVVCGQEELTYHELNSRADRVAEHLRALGVGPEARVAIFLDRSIDFVVAVIGTLKAGGAYVPLDPTHASERLRYSLMDCGATVLITSAHLSVRVGLSALTRAIIVYDVTAGRVETSDRRADNNPVVTSGENLAYVIYTSGSTGAPKGVLVTHANVLRLFAVTRGQFSFTEDDVWTLFHSSAFDFSVWEMWGALLHGGRLVIVPHAVTRDPASFLQLLASEGATVLNQTPSGFEQLESVLDSAGDGSDTLAFPSLRLVIFGGEALKRRAVESWAERHGLDQPTLINMYGITEVTVHVTHRTLHIADLVEHQRGTPIGMPLRDLRAYVLDCRGALAPIGAVGELYVGGLGVARGYLGRPALTALRFVPDPFGAPGTRAYRTGDLVRYNDNGELEYLGRRDDQVKLRGMRVELGELESAIRNHDGVSDVAVVVEVPDSGDYQLVAYVVPRAAATGENDTEERSSRSDSFLTASIRHYLQHALPEYMVPQSIVVIGALPLTANGKVDKKALYALRHSGGVAPNRTPPRNNVERAIARIWANVLGVEEVSTCSEFAALGGHSILATRVIVELRRLLCFKVPMAAIYDHPTVEQLAAYLCSIEPSAGQFDQLARTVD